MNKLFNFAHTIPVTKIVLIQGQHMILGGMAI